MSGVEEKAAAGGGDGTHHEAGAGGDDDTLNREASGVEEAGEDQTAKRVEDADDESISSVVSEEEDEGPGDEDLDEDDRMVLEMPKEERERIKDVVWAKAGKWPHYPALIYHPADISPKLRKKLYRGKQGPGNHHIVYFYGYGKNGFQAVSFKNILPWTPDNAEKRAKLIAKKDKKVPEAIAGAEADLKLAKDDRNPGPADKHRAKREANARKRAAKTRRKPSRKSGAGVRSSGGGAQGSDAEEQDEDLYSASEDGTDYEGHSKRRRSSGWGVPIADKKGHALGKIRGWWAKNGHRYPQLTGTSGEDGPTKGRRRSQGGKSKTKKEKKDYGQETPKERFERLIKNVKILLEAKGGIDVEKLCKTLGKLADIETNIVWLRDAEAVPKVKSLMQHDNGKLKNQARDLYQHWKTVLKPAAPQAHKRPRESPKKPADRAHKETAAVLEGPAPKQPRVEEATHHLPQEEKIVDPPAALPAAPTGPPSNDMEIATGDEGLVRTLENGYLVTQPTSESNQHDAVNAMNGTSDHSTACPPPFPSPKESQTRKRARTMIEAVFGETCDAGKLAGKVEDLVFELHEQCADHKYLFCLRAVCHHLKVEDMREDVVKGHMEPLIDTIKSISGLKR